MQIVTARRELKSLFGTTDAIISHLEDESVIDYGPTEPTQLSVTAVDHRGVRHTLVFEHQALYQLARLVRDIEREIPGATKGH